MQERHDREQYFFDASTRDALAHALLPFDQPCCLCCPTLGCELVQRGHHAHVLDIDERFASVPGFRRFDVTKPAWLGLSFGLIVCDPPFFTVSLRTLVRTIRMLSQHNPAQPLAVTYLKRREAALLHAFAAFGLQPTGFRCTYTTVDPSPRNAIELYANVTLNLK
ncbi:MAG: hypothetical protein AAGJ10_01630 [Bacteroidota bacterium]